MTQVIPAATFYIMAHMKKQKGEKSPICNLISIIRMQAANDSTNRRH